MGFLLIGFTLTIFSQCSDNGSANVNLVFSASENQKVSSNLLDAIIQYLNPQKAYAISIGSDVVITDFQISIEEIKFKLLDEGEDDPDIKYKGPYQIDLLNEDDVLEQALGEVEIPAGTYKEIEIVLHKENDGLEETHSLFDRSIYIAGTINGTNFEMWHDTGENLEIESDEGISIDEGTNNDLVVDFKLGSLLDNIDLTTATDGDGNGTIEISPSSADGDTNQDLAETLKENIKSIADFLKDESKSNSD